MPCCSDTKRLLHVTSPLKIWNLFLLRLNYYRSTLFKKHVGTRHPAYITIEPVNTCNLRCPQCFTTDKHFTRAKGNINKDVFKAIIDQTKSYAFYLNLYFQGEPFLNPQLSELIGYAKSQGFYVAVSTNAHFLDENNIKKIIQAGLDRIIISLDGADKDTYTAYRQNGDFTKVIEGIKNLAFIKKQHNVCHPFVELQFLVHRKNQDQINAIKQLGKQLKADKVSIRTFQIIHEQEALEWLPDKHSRYVIESDGTLHLKKKTKNRCWHLMSAAVFTQDGMLVPCCFDKNADFAMGNISTDSFQSIWENEKYRKFRNDVSSKRQQISICCNCSEH
jgi:radical SAM protein with 4Fe4S-binding SPASM domain